MLQGFDIGVVLDAAGRTLSVRQSAELLCTADTDRQLNAKHAAVFSLTLTLTVTFCSHSHSSINDVDILTLPPLGYVALKWRAQHALYSTS